MEVGFLCGSTDGKRRGGVMKFWSDGAELRLQSASGLSSKEETTSRVTQRRHACGAGPPSSCHDVLGLSHLTCIEIVNLVLDPVSCLFVLAGTRSIYVKSHARSCVC